MQVGLLWAWKTKTTLVEVSTTSTRGALNYHQMDFIIPTWTHQACAVPSALHVINRHRMMRCPHYWRDAHSDIYSNMKYAGMQINSIPYCQLGKAFFSFGLQSLLIRPTIISFMFSCGKERQHKEPTSACCDSVNPSGGYNFFLTQIVFHSSAITCWEG